MTGLTLSTQPSPASPPSSLPPPPPPPAQFDFEFIRACVRMAHSMIWKVINKMKSDMKHVFICFNRTEMVAFILQRDALNNEIEGEYKATILFKKGDASTHRCLLKIEKRPERLVSQANQFLVEYSEDSTDFPLIIEDQILPFRVIPINGAQPKYRISAECITLFV